MVSAKIREPHIIDISPTLSPRIGVWPGDEPYRSGKTLRIAEGANIDLGDMRTTYHAGAHADAPLHYAAGGADAATLPLEPYFGACQVIRVQVGRGERIRPRHVLEPIRARRVLFCTETFPDPEAWNNDFAALSEELVRWLGQQGVILVGIDTPSIDLFADKALESHHAMARFGMANLEGLLLDGVAPGLYTLIALPLRLEGADASPVRAVLIQNPS